MGDKNIDGCIYYLDSHKKLLNWIGFWKKIIIIELRLSIPSGTPNCQRLPCVGPVWALCANFRTFKMQVIKTKSFFNKKYLIHFLFQNQNIILLLLIVLFKLKPDYFLPRCTVEIKCQIKQIWLQPKYVFHSKKCTHLTHSHTHTYMLPVS